MRILNCLPSFMMTGYTIALETKICILNSYNGRQKYLRHLENDTFRYGSTCSILLHLALILQHTRSPNSMLFRCCDLRCLRNRKINIVLGEMGGGGEFFQAAENRILLSSVSIVLSLIVDQALTHMRSFL